VPVATNSRTLAFDLVPHLRNAERTRRRGPTRVQTRTTFVRASARRLLIPAFTRIHASALEFPRRTFGPAGAVLLLFRNTTRWRPVHNATGIQRGVPVASCFGKPHSFRRSFETLFVQFKGGGGACFPPERLFALKKPKSRPAATRAISGSSQTGLALRATGGSRRALRWSRYSQARIISTPGERLRCSVVQLRV
jgi:hypothetical protein